MDSGYDTTDIYEHILFEQDSQSIIPITKRNAKQPSAGMIVFTELSGVLTATTVE